MANTRETVTQTYEGESIQCAKIVVNDTADLKLPGICPINDSYIFQLVAKADAARTIMVTVGDQQITITLSTSFDRYVENFHSVNVALSNDVYIAFPSGTYYLYNLQLERALNASGWRPAPEDSEDYTDAAEASAKAYANSQVNALDTSLNQQDVFNRLTNNGQTQGIYLQDGKVYINASFIQSGTISANYISGGTIDADDVSIINLTVDHLQSFGNNNTWQLDSQASYLDLRQLDNSVWKQRGALFINNADGGTLRVSKGDVDSSGNPLSGTSYRTFVMPQEIKVGVDGSGTAQGTLTAKNINADSIMKLLINSQLKTVGSYWTLDATGVRFFLIIGQGGNSFEQSIVIPNDSSYSFGSSHTYAIGDSSSSVQFNLSVVSGSVRVTIKSVSNASCYLLRCYGII